MYKLYNDPLTGKPLDVINKTDENGTVTCIPFDPANSDYQQYLAWIEQGNVAEPADEVK